MGVGSHAHTKCSAPVNWEKSSKVWELSKINCTNQPMVPLLHFQRYTQLTWLWTYFLESKLAMPHNVTHQVHHKSSYLYVMTFLTCFLPCLVCHSDRHGLSRCLPPICWVLMVFFFFFSFWFLITTFTNVLVSVLINNLRLRRSSR